MAPATIICKANNGSHLVQVLGGGQYRCAYDHIVECPSGCCQTRYIQHWQCSTSCIYISSCHSGSETANSCCTCYTNISHTSSYITKSTQSSACSTFTTMNTDTIHWSPSKPDWHSPCCPTLINSKQEATIQAF